VQNAVAQRLGLGCGERVVEGQQLEPGQQGGGDQRGGQPGLVEGEGVSGELAEVSAFASAYGVLDPCVAR
jgi:hypothetical protein